MDKCLTVKELIKELQEFDENMPVYYWSFERTSPDQWPVEVVFISRNNKLVIQ